MTIINLQAGMYHFEKLARKTRILVRWRVRAAST